MSRTHLHTPPDLPEGYKQRTMQQGQVYFLHAQTGVSTWHDQKCLGILATSIAKSLVHCLLDGRSVGSGKWEWQDERLRGGRECDGDNNN